MTNNRISDEERKAIYAFLNNRDDAARDAARSKLIRKDEIHTLDAHLSLVARECDRRRQRA